MCLFHGANSEEARIGTRWELEQASIRISIQLSALFKRKVEVRFISRVGLFSQLRRSALLNWNKAFGKSFWRARESSLY